MRNIKCRVKECKFKSNLKSLILCFLSEMAHHVLLNFLKCFIVSFNISLSSQTGAGEILLYENKF